MRAFKLFNEYSEKIADEQLCLSPIGRRPHFPDFSSHLAKTTFAQKVQVIFEHFPAPFQ
jgi:hypothetical protein